MLLLLLLLLMLETIIVFMTNCICIQENLLFFIHIYNAQDIISLLTYPVSTFLTFFIYLSLQCIIITDMYGS